MQMLLDEHLGILLDVIVDLHKACVMVALLEFSSPPHFFRNNKVANKEVRLITTL
jgi:hypothetical protein